MHNCDKTYLALSLLVDVSRESQKSRGMESMMGGLEWAHEFCTIKITTSRGGGHTSSIEKIIDEFESVLIISMNMGMSHLLKRSIGEKDMLIYYASFNISYREAMGRKFQAVIVDCSFMMSKNKIDELYSVCLPAMSNYSEKFFIFIQS